MGHSKGRYVGCTYYYDFMKLRFMWEKYLKWVKWNLVNDT